MYTCPVLCVSLLSRNLPMFFMLCISFTLTIVRMHARVFYVCSDTFMGPILYYGWTLVDSPSHPSSCQFVLSLLSVVRVFEVHMHCTTTALRLPLLHAGGLLHAPQLLLCHLERGLGADKKLAPKSHILAEWGSLRKGGITSYSCLAMHIVNTVQTRHCLHPRLSPLLPPLAD